MSMKHMTYRVFKERRSDWRVWIVSALTGDKKECVSMHNTKMEACDAAARLWNKIPQGEW